MNSRSATDRQRNSSETAPRQFCPACGLRCVVRLNWDSAECPEHGWITGIVFTEASKMDRVDALIEIRTAQLRQWLHGRIRGLEGWLYNDSKLKIRVPL